MTRCAICMRIKQWQGPFLAGEAIMLQVSLARFFCFFPESRRITTGRRVRWEKRWRTRKPCRSISAVAPTSIAWAFSRSSRRLINFLAWKRTWTVNSKVATWMQIWILQLNNRYRQFHLRPLVLFDLYWRRFSKLHRRRKSRKRKNLPPNSGKQTSIRWWRRSMLTWPLWKSEKTTVLQRPSSMRRIWSMSGTGNGLSVFCK